MFAGFGRADLTPPMGVELAGYGYYLNRRAESVQDRLWARAVSIRQGGARCLIVSCDLLGLSERVDGAARAQLAEKLGLSDERVMLVCTHTHTGPAVDWLEGCGERDEAYTQTLPGLILEAAGRAIVDEREVTGFARCEREIEPVGFNRTRPDGPNDAHVRGAMLYRGEGRPVALINYGCHPVTLGRSTAVSADYPGWVCARMADRDVDAIFLNGLCGDIDPESNRKKWGAGTADTIRGYGCRIADGFAEGLATAPVPELAFARWRFPLSVQPVNAEFAQKASDEVCRRAGADSGEARVARAWRDEMSRRLPTEVEYAWVNAISLGPVLLVALPYEGFTAIADHARLHLSGRSALILGCADKTMGYLPAADEFARGTYAASAAAMLYMRAPFVPGQAEALGEALGGKMAATFF